MLPKVLVIILNYERPEDTIECILSVQKSDYEHFDLLVIDNASPDDSCRRIQNRFPDVMLIRNQTNLGYAGGCSMAGWRPNRTGDAPSCGDTAVSGAE